MLVPRQWTLAQARWAVALLAQLPDGPVLELCAGVTALAGRSIAGEGPIDE